MVLNTKTRMLKTNKRILNAKLRLELQGHGLKGQEDFYRQKNVYMARFVLLGRKQVCQRPRQNLKTKTILLKTKTRH